MRGLLVALVLLAPAARAQSVDPDMQAARRHFGRGLELYGAEKYAEAIVEFNEAERVMPSAALLYNIGRCQERLESWGEAADSYDRYLAEQPDDPNAASLRARVVVLRQRASKKANATPNANELKANEPLANEPLANVNAHANANAPNANTNANAPAHTKRWYRRWWVWTLAGVVLVGVAVGVGVGVSESSSGGFQPNLPTGGRGMALSF